MVNGRVHDEWKAKFISYMNGLAKNHAFFLVVSKLTLALLKHFNGETKKPVAFFHVDIQITNHSCDGEHRMEPLGC